MAGIHERAEKAFYEACPVELAGRIMRTALDAADGTLIVYTHLPADISGEALAFQILRRNGYPQNGEAMRPMVLDAEAGLPAGRLAVPYKTWSDLGKLNALWERRSLFEESGATQAGLRLLKRVPRGAQEQRYGRSGRFTLLVDRRPPLLAVRVFPGGFDPFGGKVPAKRLQAAAWVLLARSGAAAKPYPYHMLRRQGFFHVERAVALPPTPAPEAYKAIECELIRGAEDDRTILTALFQSSAEWEQALEAIG